MAQPFAVEGAIQSLDLPLGRALRDFFSPSTSTSRFSRTQSSTLPWVPKALTCGNALWTPARPCASWL